MHADKTGLINGKLIYENSELATVLGEKMKALNAPKVGLDIKVEMTFFKNWGETQESLLLYAKPTEVHQVQTLVATAGREDIKVCINGLRTFQLHELFVTCRRDFVGQICMVAHKCTPLLNTVRHRPGAAAVQRKAAAVVRKAAVIERKAATIVRRAAAVERRVAAVDRKAAAVDRRAAAVDRRAAAVERYISGRRASGRATVAESGQTVPLYRGRFPLYCGRSLSVSNMQCSSGVHLWASINLR